MQTHLSIDEPSTKSLYKVSIIAPSDQTVLANMSEESTEESFEDSPSFLHWQKNLSVSSEKSFKRVHFALTPPMSVYLFAFFTSHQICLEEHVRFSCKGQEDKIILVRAHAPPGHSEEAKFGLEISKKALHFFTDLFGVHYPLNKLDLVPAEEFTMLGMENWVRKIRVISNIFNLNMFHCNYFCNVGAHHLCIRFLPHK